MCKSWPDSQHQVDPSEVKTKKFCTVNDDICDEIKTSVAATGAEVAPMAYFLIGLKPNVTHMLFHHAVSGRLEPWQSKKSYMLFLKDKINQKHTKLEILS